MFLGIIVSSAEVYLMPASSNPWRTVMKSAASQRISKTSPSAMTSSAPASMAAIIEFVLVFARGVDEDDALALEHPTDRAVGAQLAPAAVEDVADVGSRAVLVVGEGGDVDRHPGGP